MSIYSDCSEISGKHKVQGVKNVTICLSDRKIPNNLFISKRKKMKFFFYFLLFERGKSDQPRIEVQNGDLKFTVAPSKNIFFQTDSGKIFLNGDDFSESLSSLNSKVDDTSKNVDQILGLGSRIKFKISVIQKISDTFNVFKIHDNKECRFFEHPLFIQ